MRPTNLLLFLVLVLLVAAPAAAQTTEVQVIRYAGDHSTVLNTTTVNVSWMEDNLPVFGDGVTPYLMQGALLNITDYSDPAVWNPAEDQEIDKINDTVRGTTVKDLCDLIGGMQPGDEVAISGSDAYDVRLAYENVYNPPARQGPPFLAWWGAIKLYEYAPGLRLIFGADTSVNPYGLHVFGNQDMKETLAEKYWGWYGGVGHWPSAAQLSIRNVAKVEIFPPWSNDWVIALNGGINRTVTKSFFEQALKQPGFRANYTDANGGDWEGMPLWRLVGYVDDGDAQAFNQTLAEQGYTIRVTAGDGYNRNFTSQEVALNTNYIVANTLNGTELPTQFNGKNVWPLRLVGVNATGGKSIGNITAIEVLGVPDVTPPPPPAWTLKMTGYTDYTVTSGFFYAAMACGGHTDTYTDPNGVFWTGLPLWRLIGLVDDELGHEVLVGAFNDTLAAQGYTIRVIAGDGYNKTFTSQEVARSHGYLVASTMNGSALPIEANGKYMWPLKLVGTNATGGRSIGNITEIRLENLPITPPEPDVLFDGNVTLTDGTFAAYAYNSNTTHLVPNLTAHGALQAASTKGGFSYNATDKKWADLGTFLLDSIAGVNSNRTANMAWAYTLNGVVMNDFSADQGISVQPVANGDQVVYYFGVRGADPKTATAVVRIRVVVAGVTPEPDTEGPYSGPHGPASRIEAEHFDAGGEGAAYHDVEPANLGNNNMRPGEGVDVETEAGVTNVAYIRAGEYLRYSVDTTIAGNFSLTLRAANPDPTAKAVTVYLDGSPVGEVLVGGTGGWTTYREFTGSAPFAIPAGRHVVTIAFEGVTRLNLDWLGLAAGTVVTPTPSGSQPYPSQHIVPGRVEAEDYDVGGFSDTTPANEGGAYRNDAVDIETGGSNHNVGWIRAGEYLEYTVEAAAPGTYTVGFRVANPGASKTVTVLVNGAAMTLTIPATGSFGSWQTATLSGVALNAGQNRVRIEMGSTASFNIDYMEFTTGAPPTTTTQQPAGEASFTASPNPVARSSAIKFTLTPAAGKSVRACWWTFDAVNHYGTWNSRDVNPTFFYPAAGTYTPLVKVTYTDGTTETVQRAGYVTVR